MHKTRKYVLSESRVNYHVLEFWSTTSYWMQISRKTKPRILALFCHDYMSQIGQDWPAAPSFSFLMKACILVFLPHLPSPFYSLPSSANASVPVQHIPLYLPSHLSSLFLSLPCLSWYQFIGLFLSAMVLGVKNRFQACLTDLPTIFLLSSPCPSYLQMLTLFLMLTPLLKHFCPGQVHFGPYAHQKSPILFCKWIKASKRQLSIWAMDHPKQLYGILYA